MIRHLLKIIWNQRRQNGWIFTELLVVVAILWTIMDSMLVDQYTYHSPLGFNIEDTYLIRIGELKPGTLGYIEPQELTTRTGEDMLRLIDNLRQAPEVEEVSISAVGSPYTNNNMSSTLVSADADSTVKMNGFQHSVIDPEYFDVLRITDTEGRPMRPIVGTNTGIVASVDVLEKLFGEGTTTGSATGRFVKYDPRNMDNMPLLSVCTPIRKTEYDKSNPRFFRIISRSEMINTIEGWQVMGMEVLLRMRPGFPPEKIDAFLEGMGERLVVNNVYVSGAESLRDMRAGILKSRQDTMKKKFALVGFMLVSVFFGIIGTFWLRTQSRQGELGLRVALGSNRRQLSRFINLEGLLLLLLTVPFVLVFIFNMLYFDMPDTYRLSYTWWRFLAAFGGTYLLMAGMISLGIWFPVRRAMKMEPAEALHYE